MRTLLLTLSLLGVAAQTVEPPVLPPGQFCDHPMPGGPAPQHPCACYRECQDQAQIDPTTGEPTGKTETVIKEDAQCKQWCHADHCHCPVHNCE